MRVTCFGTYTLVQSTWGKPLNNILKTPKLVAWKQHLKSIQLVMILRCACWWKRVPGKVRMPWASPLCSWQSPDVPWEMDKTMRESGSDGWNVRSKYTPKTSLKFSECRYAAVCPRFSLGYLWHLMAIYCSWPHTHRSWVTPDILMDFVIRTSCS